MRVHRGNVTRVVYLVQDRMYFAVSTDLLATGMAKPKVSDLARLKPVDRYLKRHPSHRQLCRLQIESSQATAQQLKNAIF